MNHRYTPLIDDRGHLVSSSCVRDRPTVKAAVRSCVMSQLGWSSVARLEDDASGAAHARAGKALAAARAGRFNILPVYRMDRFIPRRSIFRGVNG